ncbi:hypothetical protein EMPG_17168 [Blastomyces silverae]|uniref:Uncharacterized protein n=1 Tax=Blastomyces silverae TaxID=2060906 RepID=A0A0H1B7F4_9EURO|nr:hypothetical protein EMPG_17168 [Blastomyces silverae]
MPYACREQGLVEKIDRWHRSCFWAQQESAKRSFARRWRVSCFRPKPPSYGST